eukprot:TRINITY_DN1053_c0_g4_i1.p1 TRINITY_DN1053_c0_g4~~TRINITY_DN1053_c0_g4_i1.p1  ORF type:complete len:624 (+),score=192.62 TRINITY_DN1053_c0_g4_i1:74-1945(+)
MALSTSACSAPAETPPLCLDSDQCTSLPPVGPSRQVTAQPFATPAEKHEVLSTAGEAVLADLQRELDDQLGNLRGDIARVICQCQDIMMRIADIAQEFAAARSHEVTAQRRAEWAGRINEMLTDCRGKLASLEAPASMHVPGSALSLTLRTAGQLSHAKRLHDNLLAALRSEESCRQRLVGRVAGASSPDDLSTLEAPRAPSQLPDSGHDYGRARGGGGFGGFTPHPPISRRTSITPLDRQAQNPAGRRQSRLAATITGPPSPTLRRVAPTGSVLPSPRRPARESHSPAAEDTTHAQSPAPPQMSVQRSRELTSGQLLSAGLYLVLEALLHEGHAERAMIFKYQQARNELQAVTCCGTGLPRAGQLRMPPNNGLVGAVFTSRIAINVSSGSELRDSLGFKTDKVVSLLGMPVWSPANCTEPCGVVLLMNKHRGKSPFDPDDETTLSMNLRTVAYLLERYPVDVAAFDPSALHFIVPLNPADVPNRLIGHQGIEGHQPRNLVFRTRDFGVHMRKQLRIRSESMYDPLGMLGVTDYVRQLEACWDRSTRAQLDTESSVQVYLEQSSIMREQAKKMARKIANLKGIVRSHADENIRLSAEISVLKRQSHARSTRNLPSVCRAVLSM